MVVKSIMEAWNKADEIFPTDYELDPVSSARAGYSIYRSTAEGFYSNYICDLGDRLEVNVGATSTNIWVKEEKKEDLEKVIADQKKVIEEQAQEILVLKAKLYDLGCGR